MPIAAPRLLALTPDQHAVASREGFHVARQLFTAAEVEEIRETFMLVARDGPVPHLSDGSRTLGPSDPLSRYPRMMHPHRFPHLPVGPVAMKYMLDRRIHDYLRDLMGEEPIAAQSMFYFKPPGARGQDFHQDNFYLRVKPGTCVAAWVAIDDADAENGAMNVIPGTGDMDIACPEQSDSAMFFTTEHVPIPKGKSEYLPVLKAGDVLFFNGSLIHGSYPNTSKTRFRRSFICHYVPESCAEVSHWYRPLLTFAGQDVEKAQATGGGPCGTVQEAAAPH